MSMGTTIQVYIPRVFPATAARELVMARDIADNCRSRVLAMMLATPDHGDQGEFWEWFDNCREELEEYREACIGEHRIMLVAEAAPEEIVCDESIPGRAPRCPSCPDDETLTCSVCEGSGVALP